VKTLIVCLLVILAAAGQNIRYNQDPNWVAPPAFATKPNPLAGRTQAIPGGRKLFLRHCAECHNRDGTGLKNAADLQLPFVQKQSDGTLFWKITNGNLPHGMPSFSNLPELQRWQIVLFLRTLNPVSEGESRR
jgi:mono/diheme cytochrome c family protein